MRDVRAHYIRKNESARIPSRFVIFDCEANRDRTKKGERQTWNLAVATFLEWKRNGSITRERTRFTTATELWQAISTFTRQSKRTVVYAHNLNYDLRISQALSLLPKLGWTLVDIRLDGRGSWSKWSREKASLNLCDSASIFPVSLQILGATLGIPKLPLPNSSEREKLWQRCERDVDILVDAITRYVTWMRTGQLGNWQMTGASQAWSHWRHSHYTHKVLVHDDRDAIAAEREAMYAGRCEAWRWGLYRGDNWYEYDWQNSYPRIARDTGLPGRLKGSIRYATPESIATLSKRYCVLAELEINTHVPCVPTRSNGRIVWPTGKFTSTLWDSEIHLLRENGATFRVRRAWLYTREPILKDWAEWVLSSLHDKTNQVEPWQKLILKHWSRALIGRFGMRYRSWDRWGTAPTSSVSMSHFLDLDSGSQYELLQIGQDLFTSGELREIDDGCPQITSYVMSEARAKLWRASQAIGPANVFYMDTDSLVVNSAGHTHIQVSTGNNLYDGLRSKAHFRKVHIYGPRSIICDTKPHVSGMPKGSVKVEQDKWSGEVWRGASESIRSGEHDSVRIRSTQFQLRYNQHRRAYDGGGFTRPHHLRGNNDSPKVASKPPSSQKAQVNDYPSLRAHLAQHTSRNQPIRV